MYSRIVFFTLYCFSSVSLNYVVIKHNNNKMETEIGACVHLKSERNNNNNAHECSKDQNHLG